MPEVDGGAGADQVARLAEGFPGYTTIYGAAVDLAPAGECRARRQFGNLILSRLPVQQVFRHLLPQPPDRGVKHMPRQATEAVVAGRDGPLRIVTTHLEYHSEGQRLAQAERLRDLHAEVWANLEAPPLLEAKDPYGAPPRPIDAVYCGDFNILPDDPVYRRLLAPFDGGVPALRDAWPLAASGRPHPATCGLFDRRQWPEGGHCRDYFFVTETLAERIAGLAVDSETAASDHQPVRLTLTA